jgi:hypothetical protein
MDSKSPLTLIFDAHLFLTDQCSALASLRYFNIDNLSFESDQPEAYFVVANVRPS